MVGRPKHEGAAPRVGIFGASGTTGAELVALIARHGGLQLEFATSRAWAGQTLRDVDPAMPAQPLVDASTVRAGDVDLVFTCLPHGHSAPVVEDAVLHGALAVDLSADFRLHDAALHARVYGSDRSEELARTAVYGLPELHRDAIRGAKVIANPGCYPTCTTLSLVPLLRRGLVRGPIVVDAKSGVSGAGRAPKPAPHFVAVTDDVKPYKLGRAHRHAAEIEQTLHGAWSGDASDVPPVIFNPHVVPIERGMLTTSVVRVPGCSAGDVRGLLAETYADEPLVEILDEGPARIRAVVRTNRVQIGVSPVEGSDHVVVTSAIDNLGKGAAGQALQNANLMLGLPELTGVASPSELTASAHPEARSESR